MMDPKSDNPIEFSLLEKRIMAALLPEEREPTPVCLDPETLLDLVEQGERHPRYSALQPHIAGCAFCADEYNLLDRAWRESRDLPVEMPAALRSAESETLRPPIPTPSGIKFGEWLRRLLSGSRGASIAWGAASMILLLAAWTAWQGQQIRTRLQVARDSLQQEQAKSASLAEELKLLRQARGTTGQNNETKLADSKAEIQKLQTQLSAVQAASRQAAQYAQRKLDATNKTSKALKQQIALAANDTSTSRQLYASISGLQPRPESTRGSSDLSLRTPSAGCVLEDRPRFEWTVNNPSLVITGYEITIDGANGYHRVKKLPNNAGQWDMASERTELFLPMKRGSIYRWQLRVLVADSSPGRETISSIAKFKIASQDTVNRIAKARKSSAGRPLSLFKVYLQNGLTDDARREVNTMLDNLRIPISK